ncbi:YqjF family protein [Planomicrobium sp. YIM 101495]|uniref:YqjF family protein n=1 Tax=Planomicrobium sp. YIM 101495 TaxID=2665160 RepID=UPI0012B9859B|nr:DUF2071 domain-containing protein [Planomicrobium sp. YIM 101495]MTD31011.1 DUF2071 domain-containing protein [Planomicrobium sp. YIM 101495]
MDRWIMKQKWHDVFFLHWAVPAESLRLHVPEELELDLAEGSAWLGVVGFNVSGTRPRFLPSVPGTRTFLELNVRTYVKHGGRSGVYFFSLDANSPLAVEAASMAGFLPYRHAKITKKKARGVHHFRSVLTEKGHKREELDMSFRTFTEPLLSDAFGQWLTERYCLWTKPGKSLICVDIDHIPWDLHRMEGEIRTNTMAAFHPLDLHRTKPIAHFSPFQDVRFYMPVIEKKIP